ncbi:MAG: acyl-CoA thioesterase [Ruminococcus sp.]|nr:acyl-CoA thioesterase [Ruminococcus sp.]
MADYPKGLKRTSDSLTEITKLIQYRDINGQNRLFGGRLMEWIDEAAGVAAMRHCGGNAVTLMVDSLKFKKGAFINDILVLIAKVTYVGRTSMEVRVDTYVEEKDTGIRRAINHAYLTCVHVDSDGRPEPIDYGLEPLTITELAEWEGAQKRRAIRKQRSSEGF